MPTRLDFKNTQSMIGLNAETVERLGKYAPREARVNAKNATNLLRSALKEWTRVLEAIPGEDSELDDLLPGNGYDTDL